MRAVFITDLHLSSRNRDDVQRIFAYLKDLNPDYVFDLGDRINGCGFDSDEASLKSDVEAQIAYYEMIESLRQDIPVFGVDGNHDGGLTQVCNHMFTGLDGLGSRMIQGEDVTFMLWGADVRPADYFGDGFEASVADLDWLRYHLYEVEHSKPAVLMAHLPLDHNVQSFEAALPKLSEAQQEWKRASHWFYENGQEVKDLILGSGAVSHVLTGHLHRNHSYSYSMPSSMPRGHNSLVQQTEFMRLERLLRLDGGVNFAVIEADEKGVHVHRQSFDVQKLYQPTDLLSMKLAAE